jgi:glyoxylase-like metal-dependent hydrolase (beta-lactamase superfamily II)
MNEREIKQLVKPHEISPHLYVVSAEDPHQWNANAYLLLGEEPTLVDCGSTEGIPLLKRNLEQLGLGFADIKNVIATHGHRDHIYGIHEIRSANPDVNLYIHSGDRKAIETGDKDNTATTLYGAETKKIIFDPIKVNEKNVLRDQQILQAGEHDIYVHHTPGHTPGSVCFRTKMDDEWILFAGDTVYGHANNSGSNFDDWEESLQLLKNIEYDKILNGHNWVKYLPIKKQSFVEQIPKFKKNQWDPWRE